MIYCGSPRFQVRELEGYATATRWCHHPGLTITVVYRAYCSQVIRMWLSEELNSGGPFKITREMNWTKMRTEAAVFAAALNEGDRCTGGHTPADDHSLIAGQDHPSLSPFDSGCPR